MPYRTNQKIALNSLSNFVSIDFGGPLQTPSGGSEYAKIAVEHLTGWPIERETQDETSETVIRFMKEEVIFRFGPPKVVISDKATFFTENKLQKFIYANKKKWKTVLEYEPMRNGRAERMVETLKEAVKRLLLSSGVSWDVALSQAVYGYRGRNVSGKRYPL